MNGFGFLLLTVHLLAAMVWVGGLVFFVLVGVPLARKNPQWQLAPALGRAFRPVGWAALIVLLITGPLLLAHLGVGWPVLREAAFWRSPFGMTLLAKILLVAFVIGLTIWHDRVSGRYPEKGALYAAVRFAGRAIGVASVLIVVAGLALARGY
ncbi:MAG: copper resistance protein CopD [Gammaproteobacteria bacterium]|nr:copper resistance protein CopD [Gammaproteobacteria bacterium]